MSDATFRWDSLDTQRVIQTDDSDLTVVSTVHEEALGLATLNLSTHLDIQSYILGTNYACIHVKQESEIHFTILLSWGFFSFQMYL